MGGDWRGQYLSGYFLRSGNGNGAVMKKGQGKKVVVPHPLWDSVLLTLPEFIRNDRELAKALGMMPSSISKTRNRRSMISGDVILKVHHFTGWEISRIEFLIAGLGQTNKGKKL